MANMKYIILLSCIMVLLLPNNSLQQEEILGPVTNEDIDSIADAIRDKRSADAKLASELYAPSMLEITDHEFKG